MPEDMARAVGASGATTVTIAGKECTVRGLGIRELCEVERDCVERYRRSYLKTFADNADLLPGNDGRDLLREEMMKAAKWDVDDLPPKFAHDPDGLKITKRLRKWMEEECGLEESGTEEYRKLVYHRICATLLDQGILSGESYCEMTGKKPRRYRVGYVNWWMNGNKEGMLTVVWICFRHNGVTRDQVGEALQGKPAMLSELSREIEHLSAASVGNG